MAKDQLSHEIPEDELDQLEKLYQHFSFLNDEMSIIKFKLSEITEVRYELIESLNKIAKPWGEEEVSVQTDIELF